MKSVKFYITVAFPNSNACRHANYIDMRFLSTLHATLFKSCQMHINIYKDGRQTYLKRKLQTVSSIHKLETLKCLY